MKKLLSAALLLAVMLTLAPTASAVTVPDKAPYSTPFLDGLSGVKLIGIDRFDDQYSEGSEGEIVVFTDCAIEYYDISRLAEAETWDGAVKAVCERFEAAGYIRTDADNAVFYVRFEEDDSLQSFTVNPEREEGMLKIVHTYGYSLPRQKPGLENFRAYRRYENRFADVRDSDWFGGYVLATYELGLMSGDSPTAFNPSGNITVAETITIAARLNSIYSEGQPILITDSDTWYAPYVAYAAANGIISAGEFGNYDEPITRADFAYILSAALPKEALEEICSVVSLPDVDESTETGRRIFSLYRAGVLTGSDAKGAFYPDSTIQRSEAAAILSRMALPGLRNDKAIGIISDENYDANIKTWVTAVVGESRPINDRVPDENAPDDGGKWTTTDPSVVTVDEKGMITGVGAGSASVTKRTPDGSKASCTVNVVERQTLEKQTSRMAVAKLKGMLRRPESLHVHSVTFSRSPIEHKNSRGQDVQYYLIGVSVSFTAEGLDGKDVRTEFIIFYNMDNITEDFGSLLTAKELKQVNNLLMDEYNVPIKLS